MHTKSQGLIFAFGAMLLHALMNVYFNLLSGTEIHPLVFLSVSMLFAGLALIVKGGKTRLSKAAITSPYTWLYAVTYILNLMVFYYLMRYVAAFEASLLARMATVVSLIIALVFLNRNTLDRGIVGVPFILFGLLLVLGQIDDNLGAVIFLSLLTSVVRAVYYFSMELNGVVKQTKHYLQDFSVIGYILGCTGFVFLMALLLTGFMSHVTDYHPTPLIPALGDFYHPKMVLNALFYGVLCVTLLRYLEFKSVQAIGAEIFACVTAITPFITFVFENVAKDYAFYNEKISTDSHMLLAMFLIILGAIIIVVRRYYSDALHDQGEVQELRKYVLRATIFCRDDYEKSSDALGIDLKTLHDIMDDKNGRLAIKKSVAERIKSNYDLNIAHADALTGLANKLQFITQLKSLNTAGTLSLLYLDLNKFKPVNDKYGHAAGDMVLAETAKRLQQLAGRSGIVTRLGGDEFAILMNGMTKTDASALITEVKEAVAAPIFLAEQEVEVVIGTSVGVANYPEDISNPEHIEGLISLADKSMFRDKEQSGAGR